MNHILDVLDMLDKELTSTYQQRQGWWDAIQNVSQALKRMPYRGEHKRQADAACYLDALQRQGGLTEWELHTIPVIRDWYNSKQTMYVVDEDLYLSLVPEEDPAQLEAINEYLGKHVDEIDDYDRFKETVDTTFSCTLPSVNVQEPTLVCCPTQDNVWMFFMSPIKSKDLHKRFGSNWTNYTNRSSAYVDHVISQVLQNYTYTSYTHRITLVRYVRESGELQIRSVTGVNENLLVPHCDEDHIVATRAGCRGVLNFLHAVNNPKTVVKTKLIKRKFKIVEGPNGRTTKVKSKSNVKVNLQQIEIDAETLSNVRTLYVDQVPTGKGGEHGYQYTRRPTMVRLWVGRKKLRDGEQVFATKRRKSGDGLLYKVERPRKEQVVNCHKEIKAVRPTVTVATQYKM